MIESFPRPGPTVLSSIIFIGAGNAPDLSSKARSVADWKVKPPVICPEPSTIASWITGALIILSSKIIANLFPTPEIVALPNLFAPTLSKLNVTTVSLVWESTLGWASSKFSPLKIILLFIYTGDSDPSSNSIRSVPNSASVDFETNLKVKFAVLPRRFLIRIGSSSPGNSTRILSLPLFKIFGSFVPTSSILLLTISIAWSKEEFLSSIIPYFDNVIVKILFWFSKSNWCDLYFS